MKHTIIAHSRENYADDKDYVRVMSKHEQFSDVGMTQLAIFGMAASILMDAIWQRIIKDEFGIEKLNELAMKFWKIIGEYTYPLVEMLLKISPEKDPWLQAKKAMKAVYGAYLVPIEVVRDDDEVFEFHILNCPYNAYKAFFDVREDDYVCRNWRDVHCAWLFMICKSAGVAEVVSEDKMIMDGAICCGQKTCHVTVRRKRS